MEREGDSPFLYRWTAPDVQPSRLIAEIQELGFSVVLEVGPRGLPDARIEVPPPAEVRVRCVDAETGHDVECEDVSWHHELPSGVGSWVHAPFAFDATLACWTSRTPIGGLLLYAFGDAYASTDDTVVVGPGANDSVLELHRKESLVVVLRDGRTQIPWDEELKPQLEPAEGQRQWESWTRSAGTITLHRIESGLYKMTIPEILGYEPVAESVVRLEKGTVTEHVVELVRRP